MLDAIAAISAEDAERFRALSRGAVEIVEAGDTRFDQVCRRIDASEREAPRSDRRGRDGRGSSREARGRRTRRS